MSAPNSRLSFPCLNFAYVSTPSLGFVSVPNSGLRLDLISLTSTPDFRLHLCLTLAFAIASSLPSILCLIPDSVPDFHLPLCPIPGFVTVPDFGLPLSVDPGPHAPVSAHLAHSRAHVFTWRVLTPTVLGLFWLLSASKSLTAMYSFPTLQALLQQKSPVSIRSLSGFRCPTTPYLP